MMIARLIEYKQKQRDKLVKKLIFVSQEMLTAELDGYTRDGFVKDAIIKDLAKALEALGTFDLKNNLIND